MVNRNTKESVMEEIIEEAIFDATHDGHFFVNIFIKYLEASGFMIVPIEDPTNLRFGVE
jgi:hypothetical protein